MIDYAAAWFKLQQIPDGSKVSLMHHLQKVHKVSGKLPPQLEAVQKKPKVLGYLFDLFFELPLSNFSFTELKAWCDLTGRHLTFFEVDLLNQLYNTYRQNSRR